MTIFMMLFIEMMAARFDVFGDHEHGVGTPNSSHEDLEKSGMCKFPSGAYKYCCFVLLDVPIYEPGLSKHPSLFPRQT